MEKESNLPETKAYIDDENIENADDKLRGALFKEQCRLDELRNALENRARELEAAEKRFKSEAAVWEHEQERKRKLLRYDQDLFDQKLEILKRSYSELANDREELERQRENLRYERAGCNRGFSEQTDILFSGVDNLMALKKRYHELIKIFHPDNFNGDNRLILSINNEYELLCNEFEQSFNA